MYEFTWIDKSGKHSTTTYPEDKSDQVAYLNEGTRAGWITSWEVEYIKEIW